MAVLVVAVAEAVADINECLRSINAPRNPTYSPSNRRQPCRGRRRRREYALKASPSVYGGGVNAVDVTRSGEETPSVRLLCCSLQSAARSSTLRPRLR